MRLIKNLREFFIFFHDHVSRALIIQRIYIACDDDLDFDVINVLITWRILISLRYFSDNILQRPSGK